MDPYAIDCADGPPHLNMLTEIDLLLMFEGLEEENWTTVSFSSWRHAMGNILTTINQERMPSPTFAPALSSFTSPQHDNNVDDDALWVSATATFAHDDDDSSDNDTIRAPRSSSPTSTIREEDFRSFQRAPFIPSGRLDYHRYLTSLVLPSPSAPDALRTRYVFLAGKELEYPSFAQVAKILSTSLLPWRPENVFIIFGVLRLTDAQGFYDAGGYLLTFNKKSQAVFARYFKNLPDSAGAFPEIWEDGCDTFGFKRWDLESLLVGSVSAAQDGGVDNGSGDGAPRDERSGDRDGDDAVADASREYIYNIPRLSGSFKYCSGHGLRESVGMEMIILILSGQFLVDFADIFRIDTQSTASLRLVVEEYRNILERASVAEWLSVSGEIPMEYEGLGEKGGRMEATRKVYAKGSEGNGQYSHGRGVIREVGSIEGNGLVWGVPGDWWKVR